MTIRLAPLTGFEGLVIVRIHIHVNLIPCQLINTDRYADSDFQISDLVILI